MIQIVKVPLRRHLSVAREPPGKTLWRSWPKALASLPQEWFLEWVWTGPCMSREWRQERSNELSEVRVKWGEGGYEGTWVGVSLLRL